LYATPWQKNNRRTINQMNTGEWKIVLTLLKKGARWGDLEVFSIEENLEILTKPSKRDPPNLVTMIERKRIPTVEAVPKKTFTEKLAQFSLKKKTSCMTQCLTCSFARNTNPPEHFTESQKAHCCAYCSMTGGQSHGGRCQRISM